jgi:hypothetical protein
MDSTQSEKLLRVLGAIESHLTNSNRQSQTTSRPKSNQNNSSTPSPQDSQTQADQMNRFQDALMKSTELYKELTNYSEELNSSIDDGSSKIKTFGKIFYDFSNDILGGIPKKIQKFISSPFKNAIKNATGFINTTKTSMLSLKSAMGSANSSIAKIGVLTKFVGKAIGGITGPLINGLAIIGKTMINVFVQGLKYGTAFARKMIALPLVMTASAAKIGNSIRSDIVETIGNAVEASKDLFDISEQYGGGLGKVFESTRKFSEDNLVQFKDMNSELVKLYGYGAAGAAALNSKLPQLIQGMGQYAELLGGVFENKGALAYFDSLTRQLGFGAEGMKYFYTEARVNGDGIVTTFARVQEEIKYASIASGLNFKKMSKDFEKLRVNVVQFGHLTNSELLDVTENLTKMGLSMEAASAVFSKFDTFESAAQSAALLSQTFGMNVDALRLIKEEDPSKIAEMLSDAMLATGRSFDELSRHEKSVMTQYTGLNGEMLRNIMNYKNMGMSFEEATQKAKENDPTAVQMKSMKEMTSSLKQIRKIMTDTSFFSAFSKGLVNTLTLNSDLTATFVRASSVMQDFFTKGLQFTQDPKTKSAIGQLFSPINDALIAVVGDGKSNKGIFDANIMGKALSDMVQYAGPAFEEALKSGKGKDKFGMLKLQNRIALDMSNAFSFENISKNPANPIGKLLETSGQLVGKFLKAFTAFAPGIIKTISGSFKSVIGWLSGNLEGEEQKTISKMMYQYFGLGDGDMKGIKEAFTTVIDELAGMTSPLWDLFKFVQKRFLEMMSEGGAAVIQGAAKAAGYEGFMDNFRSDETIFNMQTQYAQDRGFELRNISTDFMSDFYDSYDEEDIVRGMASTLEAMKSEIKKTTDYSQRNKMQGIISTIQRAQSAGDVDESSIADSVIAQVAALIDEREKNSLGTTLNIIKTKSAQDDVKPAAVGSSIITPLRDGYEMTTLSPLDQIMAGMPNGPIVKAIKYSGDAAMRVEKLIYSAISSKPIPVETKSQKTSQSERPIEVILKLDNDVVARHLLSNNFVGKAKKLEYTQGSDRLTSSATVNQSGGSSEISSIG